MTMQTVRRMDIFVALTLSAACGGDNDPSEDAQRCYEVCAAQAAAEQAGDCSVVSEAGCRALCDAQLSTETCNAEFTELNDCRLTGDFSCGLFSAESDAECSAEENAYVSCSQDTSPMCEGAVDGFCPAVPCDCPGGETMVSGVDNAGDSCKCATEETCQDFCF